MKIGAGVVAALALASVCGACSPSNPTLPPERLRSMYDVAHRLLTGRDDGWRCQTEERVDGMVVGGAKPKRICLVWRKPRVFHGIFVQEFEGHRFLENAKPSPRYAVKDRVWLSLDEQSDVSVAPALEQFDDYTRIWDIAFVGRANRYGGRFGHMGVSDGEVLVDRVIRAREVARYEGYLPDGVVTEISSGNRR